EGLRLAEDESGELDEAALGVDLALRRFTGCRLEAGAGVSAQGPVLGLGAYVERCHPASADLVLVGIDPVVTAASALVELRGRAAGLERIFGADPPGDLDAGIGSGNVEESGAVGGAHLHVFDRLGFYGQIGSMRPADHHESRRATEQNVF